MRRGPRAARRRPSCVRVRRASTVRTDGRSIPARGEEAYFHEFHEFVDAVYSRARGGGVLPRVPRVRRRGVSPRAGEATAHAQVRTGQATRIIPVWAGNSCEGERAGEPALVHPRVCGAASRSRSGCIRLCWAYTRSACACPSPRRPGQHGAHERCGRLGPRFVALECLVHRGSRFAPPEPVGPHPPPAPLCPARDSCSVDLRVPLHPDRAPDAECGCLGLRRSGECRRARRGLHHGGSVRVHHGPVLDEPGQRCLGASRRRPLRCSDPPPGPLHLLDSSAECRCEHLVPEADPDDRDLAARGRLACARQRLPPRASTTDCAPLGRPTLRCRLAARVAARHGVGPVLGLEEHPEVEPHANVGLALAVMMDSS